MKYLTLLFLSFLISSVYAQNKKSLLLEITSFKNKQIMEATFKVSEDSLEKVCNLFFKQKKFLLAPKAETGIVYYKQVLCDVEKEFINNTNTKNYSSRSFFVTVNFKLQNDGFLPEVSSTLKDSYNSSYEYQQAVLSKDGTQKLLSSPQKQRCFYKGKLFYFDKMELKHFLYTHFKGKNLPVSNELTVKVENHNKKQNNKKKKLILGRDY